MLHLILTFEENIINVKMRTKLSSYFICDRIALVQTAIKIHTQQIILKQSRHCVNDKLILYRVSENVSRTKNVFNFE